MAVVVALLINPVGLVFWLALGLTIWFAVNRTDRERRRYLRAIHPKHPEIGRFFWIGLVVGALVSLVMVIGRLQISLAALLALSGLTLVALLFSKWRFSPWWLGLASLAAVGQSGLLAEQHAANLAMLVGLLWLTQAGLARFNRGDEIESPVIQQDRRQRQSAAFELRQLFWVPLILPVAVENVSNLPLLAVTVQSLTFVGLPLLLGATFMTPRDRAQTAWRRSWPWYGGAGGVLIVYGIVARTMTLPLLVSLVFPAVVSLVLVGGFIWQGRQVHLTVTLADQGVVLIGVVPHTPAAEMGLQPGDSVLACNHNSVNNSRELYDAIQKEPTYCRLRLRQADGELRLAETAIFAGAPHELGMILFPEETA